MARKMVLVDPRMVRPTIKDKTLSQLDEQIESVLNSDLPDDLKAKQYMMALNRSKHYDAVPKTPTSSIVPDNENFEEIVNSLDQNQKFKARRILTQLKSEKDLTISEKGEISLDGKTVPGSDINVLLDNLLSKKRVTTKPTGLTQMLDSIKEVGVSSHLISNPKHKEFLAKREKNEEAADVKPSAKKSKRSVKKKTTVNRWLEYDD